MLLCDISALSLLIVHLVEGELSGRTGRKRGRKRKEEVREGGVVSRARLESLPRETKGGRCQLSSKLKELLMPIQR